ncbi:helix-turn-helix transcriptional regulator [Rubrimonas cliftonensis]|uniref:WYL domain-containing protein n=1 Tax=Rubrimonas cliftonensis TaxID=89524 RepID=A0A1H4D5X9_9RHOB|nr:WYL domain-containing protein [Rubrimonas cliftonensis]SEA67946.1 WYL domain-containing protein [Rubrimonas cliftonensis]
MLEEVGQAQRERLFHIDFRTWFLGSVSRGALIGRFGIKEAAATRDLALYRKLAPMNLDFDGSNKIYRCARAFAPLFEHPPERTLTAIAEGLGDDAAGAVGQHVRTERPLRLNAPDIGIIAAVSRAIAEGRGLRIGYHSLSSGRTEREIAPFALVDTGVRWHARAFDRRSGGFRDFVLTRIDGAELLGAVAGAAEQREADDQWMRMVELELVPHPGLERPEAVARDYAMEEGVLRTRLRAATVGYALLHWSVDASPDHQLDPARHQLWLRNGAALYGVGNLAIAPGASAG